MAIGKDGEAPLNALLYSLLDGIRMLPSDLQKTAGDLAKAMGNEELAEQKYAQATELQNRYGGTGRGRVDFKGLLDTVGEVGAATKKGVQSLPADMQTSVGNIAKLLGNEELAGERYKDAERLRKRYVGDDDVDQDATIEEAIEQRMADLEADRAAKTKVSDEPAIRKRDARFLDRLDERVLEDLLTEPVEDSDYDPTKNEMYGSGPDDTPPKAEAMSPAATAATEAALGAVEEATAEPEVDYTNEAVGLFKNTHGTEFDPNSKMDREKLEKMKGMLAKQGGLGEMSANQFALQVYRNS